MTSKDEMQLKPCPFCGERADVQYRKGDYAGYYIACPTEDCCGSPSDDAFSFVKKEYAIATWNTRKDISPLVPDDVAEAVKVLNMLDGHDLWVKTLQYPEDGRDGYRSTCPVRKEAFKAAKETLIRAASTPSAEVGGLREALVKISRMSTMPDKICNTYTLAAARMIAQEALNQKHTGGK